MKKYTFISKIILILTTFTMFSCKKDAIDWYRPVGSPMSSNVKFMNALPNSRMDFYTYTTKITSGIRYGDTTVAYSKTPYGNIIVYGTNFNNTSARVSGATSAATPQMNGQGLVANYFQTMFACKSTDSTSAETMILLRDNLETPASGQSHIRFVHLAQRGTTTIKALDVASVEGGNIFTNMRYQIPSNAVRIIPSSTASPGTTGLNTPGLGVFTSGPYTPVAAGAYTINVKAAGTEDILTTKPVVLESGKIYTMYTVGVINGAIPLELKIIKH